MSALTYQQITDSKSRTKFYSPSENKIFTKTEIIKIVTWDWNRVSDEDNYNLFVLASHSEDKPVIPCDLELIEKFSFFREDLYHSFDCEFAIGRSCWCWCGEKYHGLRGEGAERRERK